MSQRPPAVFVTDSAGLNFLNSIATPLDVEIDWIGDGEGLLSWLQQAHLVPTDVLSAIRGQAKAGELDRVAAQARALREWARAFIREHMGKPLRAADLAALEPLNQLLTRDEGFGQLVAHGRGKSTTLELQRSRRWRSPESLLLPIGEALAKLVAEEDFSDIKRCEGSTCTLMFADRTRGCSRRWCSMAICGNRAKQTAHRLKISR